jgi:uncharacterized protein (DUF58 family)
MARIRLTPLLYTFYRRGERFSQGLRRRVTEAGWFMIIATFVIGLSGIDTLWSLHYQIFSIMLMILAVALLSLFVSRRPQLTVRRHCPRFATAGTDMRYPVTLTNHGRRTYQSLRLREWLAQVMPTRQEFVNRPEPREKERNLFDRTFIYYRWMWLLETKRLATGIPSEELALKSNESVRVMMHLRPRRRGILALSGMRVLRQDQFGMFQRALRIPDGKNSILILPKRYPIAQLDLPGRRQLDDPGVGVSASSIGQSEEFVGLRDYRPGDPPRHIHWRSWARLNRPVVKEFEEEHFPRYALALDTFLDPNQDSEFFEEAVSVAASFLSTEDTREAFLDFLFVADQTYCFSMGGPGASRASERMLEVLATVEPRHDDAALQALSHSVLGRANSLSAAIFVCTQWDEERHAMVQDLRAHGVYCLVLVITEERRPSEANLHFLPMGEVANALTAIRAQ